MKIVILLISLFLFFIFYSFTSTPSLAAVGHSIEYRLPLPPSSQKTILGEKSTLPFSLTISDLTADFGILSPGLSATQSSQLTISTGSTGGHQVAVFENHPLKMFKGSTVIADTTCDDGSCNETVARPWTNHKTHGFGFNAAGNDVVSDFIDNSYYRQFANKDKGETPQIIISWVASSYNPPPQTKTATITYKVNISGSQPAGRYENEVTFVAIPKY